MPKKKNKLKSGKKSPFKKFDKKTNSGKKGLWNTFGNNILLWVIIIVAAIAFAQLISTGVTSNYIFYKI